MKTLTCSEGAVVFNQLSKQLHAVKLEKGQLKENTVHNKLLTSIPAH
jgi:hypothetical protein